MAHADAWHICVQAEPFEVGQELHALQQATPQAGAIVSFIGLVRDQFSPSDARNAGSDNPDTGKGSLEAIQIEHYPGMTEKALNAIAQQAAARWPLLGLRLIHRIGWLEAQAPIVLVATSSLHRQAAFEACAFIMDYLKTDAPFWKKEIGPQGEQWVEAHATDEQAKQQWKLAQ